MVEAEFDARPFIEIVDDLDMEASEDVAAFLVTIRPRRDGDSLGEEPGTHMVHTGMHGTRRHIAWALMVGLKEDPVLMACLSQLLLEDLGVTHDA